MKLVKNRVFRGIFLLMCILLAVGIVRSAVDIWQKHGIVGEREAILHAEEVRQQQLTVQLQEATSSAFIEEEARDKLGLVRPGESVVIMNQEGVGAASEASSAAEPIWREWWELFF